MRRPRLEERGLEARGEAQRIHQEFERKLAGGDLGWFPVPATRRACFQGRRRVPPAHLAQHAVVQRQLGMAPAPMPR